jgi:hypothetical protein
VAVFGQYNRGETARQPVCPGINDENQGARGFYSMTQTTSPPLSEYFMVAIGYLATGSQQGEGSLRRKEHAV